MDIGLLVTLARYRVATKRVFEEEFGKVNKDYFSERVRTLLRLKYIEREASHPIAGQGKSPDFFWLTAKGAREASIEIGEAVSAPRLKRTVQWQHREGIARVGVAVRKLALACKGEMSRFVLESDTQEKGFKRATTLPYGDGSKTLAPDALIGLTLADGHLRPLAVEFENGANRDNPQNVLGKREPYFQVLTGGAIERFFGSDEPPRVLIVCATETLMRKTIEGWRGYNGVTGWPIYLQTLDVFTRDPTGKWFRIDGPACPLFVAQ